MSTWHLTRQSSFFSQGCARLGTFHARHMCSLQHVHPVCGALRRWNLKRAIVCSLDVYVQAATNGTPCGCARLGFLHDRRGTPCSMSPRSVVHPDDGI